RRPGPVRHGRDPLPLGCRAHQRREVRRQRSPAPGGDQDRPCRLGDRANAALADLFTAWGQSLVANKQFQAGIDKYRLVATVDSTGNLTAATNAGLATAYAGFAQWYTQLEPADYPNALTWYQNLVKEFPDSPEAKQAKASLLLQTLYSAVLAFVQQMRFHHAHDAITDLVTN